MTTVTQPDATELQTVRAAYEAAADALALDDEVRRILASSHGRSRRRCRSAWTTGPCGCTRGTASSTTGRADRTRAGCGITRRSTSTACGPSRRR